MELRDHARHVLQHSVLLLAHLVGWLTALALPKRHGAARRVEAYADLPSRPDAVVQPAQCRCVGA